MLLTLILLGSLFVIGKRPALADCAKNEIVKPVVNTGIKLAGELTSTTVSIADKTCAGFINETSTIMDKIMQDESCKKDIERIKQDWAYIIGKSDKPSAKSSYKRTSRPTLQSQRLMNRF